MKKLTNKPGTFALVAAPVALALVVGKQQEQLIPSIEVLVDPRIPELATTQDELKKEPWLLKPDGSFDRGNTVRVTDARQSEGRLSLVIVGGLSGYDETSIVLNFQFDHDEGSAPKASAEVMWHNCLSPEEALEQITGRVRVQRADAKDTRKAWTIAEPARIHFVLHGSASGAAYCAHGEVYYNPTLESGKQPAKK